MATTSFSSATLPVASASAAGAGGASSSSGGYGGQRLSVYSDNQQQSRAAKKEKKKLGHRRVKNDGEVTYKKFETTQLIGSIQLGIQHSVGSLANLDPNRDLLMLDFMSIDTVYFTKDGLLQKTPAHNYSEFRFRTYAAMAFRRFRELFKIETDMYLASLCSEPMIELSNAGASGSIFYVTSDDNFICKTVQHKEAEFLQKISMGYYLNLDQNQRTLLPKFFGLYCYSCNAKNVRLVVMNNLFPSELRMHCKFDLKGSTYKRKANRQERAKSSPTYKDLDFLEMFPEGLTLQNDLYHSLMNSIERDCRVLESFKIMDYSLLVGIHNLDQATKDRESEAVAAAAAAPNNTETAAGAVSDWESGSGTTDGEQDNVAASSRQQPPSRFLLERQGSVVHRERMIAHSTALESITMMDVVDHHPAAASAQAVPAPASGPSTSGGAASSTSGAAAGSSYYVDARASGAAQGTSASADTSSAAAAAAAAAAAQYMTTQQAAAAAMTSYDDVIETNSMSGGTNNVWGGIPAKNHRGENLLLFIGIIDILQCYGMFKKVEHYWKSLIHDGDAVSVHRPSFYARRFQTFMKDKVFKKQVVPSSANNPNAAKPSAAQSFRRSGLGSGTAAANNHPHQQRRTTTLSTSSDKPPVGSLPPAAAADDAMAANISVGGAAPVRGADNSVTVITIDNNPHPSSASEEVFLPPVLQDRKPRVSSVGQDRTRYHHHSGGGGSSDNANNEQNANGANSNSELHKLEAAGGGADCASGGGGAMVAGTSSSASHQPATPSSTLPKILKGISAASAAADSADRMETGSIITMTSDERVQIFVPSPSGGGTPYSTITKTSNQEFLLKTSSSSSSAVMTSAAPTANSSFVNGVNFRPPSTSISWNEATSSSASASVDKNGVVVNSATLPMPPKSRSAGVGLENAAAAAVESSESESSPHQNATTMVAPPFAKRVIAGDASYRSLTPLNMDVSADAGSLASTPNKQIKSTTAAAAAAASSSSSSSAAVTAAAATASLEMVKISFEDDDDDIDGVEATTTTEEEAKTTDEDGSMMMKLSASSETEKSSSPSSPLVFGQTTTNQTTTSAKEAAAAASATIVDSELPSLSTDGVASLTSTTTTTEQQPPLSLSDIQLIDGDSD